MLTFWESVGKVDNLLAAKSALHSFSSSLRGLYAIPTTVSRLKKNVHALECCLRRKKTNKMRKKNTTMEKSSRNLHTLNIPEETIIENDHFVQFIQIFKTRFSPVRRTTEGAVKKNKKEEKEN